MLVTIPGFVPVIDLQRYNLIYVHKGDKYKKGCVLKPVVVTFIVLPLNSHVQMFRRDFLACTLFCFFLLSHFWSFCTHLHIYRYSTLNFLISLSTFVSKTSHNQAKQELQSVFKISLFRSG